MDYLFRRLKLYPHGESYDGHLGLFLVSRNNESVRMSCVLAAVGADLNVLATKGCCVASSVVSQIVFRG